MITLITIGLYYIGQKFSEKITAEILFLYRVSFVGFQTYYFSEYKDLIGQSLSKGLEAAYDFADTKRLQKGSPTIYISDSISYPNILFYSKIPVIDFINTVEYRNYPNAFLSPSKFGIFHYSIDYNHLDKEGVYLSPYGERDIYLNSGFNVSDFDYMSVAN